MILEFKLEKPINNESTFYLQVTLRFIMVYSADAMFIDESWGVGDLSEKIIEVSTVLPMPVALGGDLWFVGVCCFFEL